jgi:hypothetical protein
MEDRGLYERRRKKDEKQVITPPLKINISSNLLCTLSLRLGIGSISHSL